MKYFSLFLLVLPLSLFAQNKKKYNVTLSPSGIVYNSFIGKDAQQLKNDMEGFGSISGLTFVDNVMFNSNYKFSTDNKVNLFTNLRLGILAKKFRFTDNLILEKDSTTGVLYAFSDPDLNKDYGDAFFSYGKSKLVSTYFRINPELVFNFNVSEKWPINISVGPVFDLLLGVKHKRKFYENDDKEKIKITKNKNFNLNTYQFGIRSSIYTKIVGINYAYYFTPFFQSNKGPEVKLFELGLFFNLEFPDKKKED